MSNKITHFNKKLIIIFILFFTLIFFSQKYLEYCYERIILANNPTVLFPCEEFGLYGALVNELNENKSLELFDLRIYLKKIDGDISIEEVGRRCPNKYQFEIWFESDAQRVEIEEILEDQRIDGVPVFLRNT